MTLRNTSATSAWKSIDQLSGDALLNCMVRAGIFFLILLVTDLEAAENVTIRLMPEEGISRAEVFVARPVQGKKVNYVLIFCPGQNESSERMLRHPDWLAFGKREGLVLVGLHFESPDGLLSAGKGYFVASESSGRLLEEGLKKAGLDGLPLLLYGFSGGAHFAMSFASWRPQRVMGLCAYSFAWWSAPSGKLDCPALIVCGQADARRYGVTLGYFQAGRKARKPWCWVSLKDQKHEESAALDEFVRQYFACLLEEKDAQAIEVDNVLENEVKRSICDPITTSVLPCAQLLGSWRRLHHP